MASESELIGYRGCIYDKQPDFLFGEQSLNPVGKFLFKFFVSPCAVKQEYAALFDLGSNIILLDKTLVMTGDYIT